MPTTRTRPADTVLYVDDETKSLRNFARLLGDRFNVVTAGSVDEAVTILNDPGRRIGVLITDQRMPGRTGVDLLRHTREKYPQIVRILTTAYSDLDSAVEAVNQGEVWRYINKPWHPDALYNEIRQALALFELRTERDQLLAEKQRTMRLMVANARLQAVVAGICSCTGLVRPYAALKAYLTQTAAVDPVSVVDESSTPLNQAAESELVRSILARFQRLTETLRHDRPQAGRTFHEHDIGKLLQDICRDRGVALEAPGGDHGPVTADEHALRLVLECVVALAAHCGKDGEPLRCQALSGDETLELSLAIERPATPPGLFIAAPLIGPAEAVAQRVGSCLALYLLAEALSAAVRIGQDEAHWSVSLSLPVAYTPPRAVGGERHDSAEEIESIFEWFNHLLAR
jgi:FixJ family two-component response regulator